MLLVPSETRVERTDAGAADLLRGLAALLPDAWIVVGTVASKPISDHCSRGHTRPFDAVIIGERTIFALDIWSPAGPITNQEKLAFFARVHDDSGGFWQGFRRETEKLKALLQDRFEVEPGRVVPDKIWSREAEAGVDSGDLRSFARAAIRQDKASGFPPLRRGTIDRIATFLAADAKVAPEPAESRPVLLFTDDSPMPTAVAGTTAVPAAPAPVPPSKAVSRPAPPKDPEAAKASPAPPPPSTQPELLLQQETPVTPPATPAPKKASRPAPAAPAVAPPVVATAAEAPTADDKTAPSFEQVTPSLASVLTGRATTHWKWLVGLLLVAQAGAIAWLARDPPQIEPAPQVALAAPAPPVESADPAPAAPTPAPFVVRSLAASEPMRVGDRAVTLRAGPSPEFPVVGELDAGTEVVASASASGPGDTSWIEIASNGVTGFVPDNLVRPDPAEDVAIAPDEPLPQAPKPTITRAVASEQAPAPKIKRAVTSKGGPAPKVKRAVASKQVRTAKVERDARPAQRPRPKAASAPSGVLCILPGGEEIRVGRSECRAQSGIIYQ